MDKRRFWRLFLRQFCLLLAITLGVVAFLYFSHSLAHQTDADWIRLLEWEALQKGAATVIGERERRAASADWLERLRQRQKQGQLTAAFDPGHLAVAMQSLTLFPAAFPQLVRLSTGKSVRDPAFQRGYRAFLKAFAAAFKPDRRPGGRHID